MDAHFYFDATCAWTWMASRWLLEVGQQRDVRVIWHTLSLALLDGDSSEHPPEPLRVVESLRARGHNDQIGRFYTEYGYRVHLQGLPADAAVLEEAARTSAVEDHLPAATDTAWDGALRMSLQEALASAGPDVGSPVLVLGGNRRGAFGPIVSPAPTGDEALRLWEGVVALHSSPCFLELKRGRTGPPAVGG